ncbi:MAG: phosphoribosylformylglycinamidine synthase [Atopobiaceae bacterium]|nr:phosphoribosylformylglycinamidine synthase [Atopobiaceae bacterium]
MVLRVYVEKRPGFDVEAQQLTSELTATLGIGKLEQLRIINRYDVEGISEELFERCIPTVFSEPQSDYVYRDLPEFDGATQLFAVEALPGQFDQRAASAAECIQLISQGERLEVLCAKLYVFEGSVSKEDLERAKNYLINPVEAREATLELLDTVSLKLSDPEPVEQLAGFIDLSQDELARFVDERELAMDLADINFCQEYFKGEGRDPSITEIKMIDTYWSDHCRHTTFGTELTNVSFEDSELEEAWQRYLSMRETLGRQDKPLCLMDMATIAVRWLKREGKLTQLDESEEINACTVKLTVDVDGKDEDWLLLFKNETHNHPTEIEPFGGAATCIGGAIRDPLSGRSYVYQAMRVTGAADPRVPVDQTIPGKLPQRKIVTTAAEGYSSYGNQIGLATGQVHELYHPGYLAKRMEIGAVVGATPERHVRRERPAPGDKIVLLGGRTGRDGIGGATGSSKAHKVESLADCGAEVQKGNATMERKLQRLFRREDACKLIKRCNDFGAGGVSVAIGELADGLSINLDAVPKKYEGLDGTELAISESQERMAVALAPEDVEQFCALAEQENLEASVVAEVTEDPRLRMTWRGDTIVDVSREFLASNGAPKSQDVVVEAAQPYHKSWGEGSLNERMQALVSDINVASNKGLSERFDSTIGAATVLMPFGGASQLTPTQAMVAKLPVFGKTSTCSGMAWGYNPYLMEHDQYRGAYISVVESLSRLVAAGFEHEQAYLTFQEYFERLRDEPQRWGKPVAALLGALDAQVELGVGAIGGKDSMSGSFEDLDVPPTLVSFAVGAGKVERVCSNEFKGAGHRLVSVVPNYRSCGIVPQAESFLACMNFVEELTARGWALSVSTPGYGAVAEQLFKSALGNSIGVELVDEFSAESLFAPAYGSFIVELSDDAQLDKLDADKSDFCVAPLGYTTDNYVLSACGEHIELSELQELWESALEDVFAYRGAGKTVERVQFSSDTKAHSKLKLARPRVIIPVFPGTNCEYDTVAAFEQAGAEAQVLVLNNLNPTRVSESVEALAKAIDKSQIIMLPGGFSGADEPDGSAKFITSVFRAPAITDAVRRLLFEHDGLMLGICNGFQALVKLGLVPYGDIREMDESCPTLTFNNVGRHQSRLVRTRVASSLSPWLSRCELGDIHTIAISHGEGRFVVSDELLSSMLRAGQVATQYVDEQGTPSMDLSVNPNGSVLAIEGITSPDGRILGKMGHSERRGAGLYKNVPGNSYQELFEGGVDYFS